MRAFPASDSDRAATQDFVRAEIAGIRTEIGGLRGDLRTEIGSVRTELAQLEVRINERLREQTVWMGGALVTGMGVAVGLASLL